MNLINYGIISLTICTFLINSCSSVDLKSQQDIYSTNGYTQQGSIRGNELIPNIYRPLPNKVSKELTNPHNQVQNLTSADYLGKNFLLEKTKKKILKHTNSRPEIVKIRMSLLSNNLPKGEEKQQNEVKLWHAVQNLTESEMADLDKTTSPILKGFFKINRILRDQTLSIKQQLTAYKKWQANNSDHPAAINEPQDFKIIANLNDIVPEKIVLMLPMGGKLNKASQAIMNGFLNAYYYQRSPRANITIINTDDYTNIQNALNAADAQNPDVIIGPLEKNNVTKISRMDLQHPVIALNQISHDQRIPNLYYFSLDTKDDIDELISFTKQVGVKKSAILSTQSTWALRQSNEFRAATTKANINITADLSYDNTFKSRKEAVQKLLLINESKSRIHSIQNWVDEDLNTEVRPRQDLDCVYFVGTLSDAKQIRPLLNFNFSQNIPMLASSTLDDTPPEKSMNFNDIEHILFAEIPSIIQEKNALEEVSTEKNSNILNRLHALGADAYLLANRYQLFVQLPTTKLSANTGIITMDKYGTFHNRPEIMTYRNGHVVRATSTQLCKKRKYPKK